MDAELWVRVTYSGSVLLESLVLSPDGYKLHQFRWAVPLLVELVSNSM